MSREIIGWTDYELMCEIQGIDGLSWIVCKGGWIGNQPSEKRLTPHQQLYGLFLCKQHLTSNSK